MHTMLVLLSLILLLIVFLGALRSAFQVKRPFLHTFSEAGQAYIVLTALAGGLLAWGHFGNRLQIRAVEVPGFKAEIEGLQQKVTTLSEQMEVFFNSKKVEVFNRNNWNRVRTVENSKRQIALEVTLEQEPIPNSVEVFEGVLLMPEQNYQVSGKVIRFPANTDKPGNGLTIKYYPRIATARSQTQ